MAFYLEFKTAETNDGGDILPDARDIYDAIDDAAEYLNDIYTTAEILTLERVEIIKRERYYNTRRDRYFSTRVRWDVTEIIKQCSTNIITTRAELARSLNGGR